MAAMSYDHNSKLNYGCKCRITYTFLLYNIFKIMFYRFSWKPFKIYGRMICNLNFINLTETLWGITFLSNSFQSGCDHEINPQVTLHFIIFAFYRMWYWASYIAVVIWYHLWWQSPNNTFDWNFLKDLGKKS